MVISAGAKDEHTGWPPVVTIDKNVAQARQVVLNCRRIKFGELAKAMRSSEERVCDLLNERIVELRIYS